jgi:hypothetical protein
VKSLDTPNDGKSITQESCSDSSSDEESIWEDSGSWSSCQFGRESHPDYGSEYSYDTEWGTISSDGKGWDTESSETIWAKKAVREIIMKNGDGNRKPTEAQGNSSQCGINESASDACNNETFTGCTVSNRQRSMDFVGKTEDGYARIYVAKMNQVDAIAQGQVLGNDLGRPGAT